MRPLSALSLLVLVISACCPAWTLDTALMPHNRAESTPEVCLEVLISVKYFWVCSQIYIWFPISLCFQYSNKSNIK